MTWYLVYGWPTISGEHANRHRERLQRELRDHKYRNILVIQVVEYPEELVSEDSVHLHPDLVLETLYEKQISEYGYTRVSRVRPE